MPRKSARAQFSVLTGEREFNTGGRLLSPVILRLARNCDSGSRL